MKVKVFLTVEMETEIKAKTLEGSSELKDKINHVKHVILTTNYSGVKLNAVKWEQSEELK